MESIEHSRPNTETERINELAIKVQPALALHVYHRRHPEIEVDELNPRNNPSEIRAQAMTEWLGTGSAPSDSEMFRNLISDKEFVAKLHSENIESVFEAYDAATIH